MPRRLTESDIFALLAKRHRRQLLAVLRESETPLATDELAGRIADRDLASPTADDRTAVRISLYHHHLPRLEVADVVAYDEDEELVRPGVNFDTVVGVLERTSELDVPWTDE